MNAVPASAHLVNQRVGRDHALLPHELLHLGGHRVVDERDVQRCLVGQADVRASRNETVLIAAVGAHKLHSVHGARAAVSVRVAGIVQHAELLAFLQDDVRADVYHAVVRAHDGLVGQGYVQVVLGRHRPVVVPPVRTVLRRDELVEVDELKVGDRLPALAVHEHLDRLDAATVQVGQVVVLDGDEVADARRLVDVGHQNGLAHVVGGERGRYRDLVPGHREARRDRRNAVVRRDAGHAQDVGLRKRVGVAPHDGADKLGRRHVVEGYHGVLRVNVVLAARVQLVGVRVAHPEAVLHIEHFGNLVD